MVDLGAVSPDWKPMVSLLDNILDRIQADLSRTEVVGLSITASHGDAIEDSVLVPLAAQGEGAGFVDAEARIRTGPVLEAARAGQPVVTADVWIDSRWPRLTRDAVADLVPADVAARMVGVVAVPSGWDTGGIVVLSARLAIAADEDVLKVLLRYEQLVASALAVVHASTAEGPGQVLGMLQARSVIEQAKGAIIAVAHCDAHTAWQRLQIASQHFNVKLRDLAVALIEHLGHAPAEQPRGLPSIVPDDTTRRAAERLWAAITTEIGPARR
ncbi:ANTAR domain-containing protein [Amycolatopsis sp. cmx-4-54]|uniref:ANTAR domain-containing protein n=1 Tax=Amycolatopsis sp. cmx-4-54 TaxID=2790936 RepID=UPI00397C1EF6